MEFDIDLARRAHAWISYHPEERAEQCRQEATSHLAAVEAEMKNLAQTDDQRAILATELDRYRTGYLTRYHAMLEARSRTASSGITGASKFPTARNRKRLDTEQRRTAEFLEWAPKASAAMRKAIMAARTDDQVDDDRWNELRRHIIRDMGMVKAIDGNAHPGFRREAFTGGIAASLRKLLKRGERDLVQRALVFIREQQATWEKPFLSARSGLWAEAGIEPVAEVARRQSVAA